MNSAESSSTTAAWATAGRRPAARSNPGERVIDALVREVREEPGLRIEIERFVEIEQFVGVYSAPSFQILDYHGGEFTSSPLFSPALPIEARCR